MDKTSVLLMYTFFREFADLIGRKGGITREDDN